MEMEGRHGAVDKGGRDLYAEKNIKGKRRGRGDDHASAFSF